MKKLFYPGHASIESELEDIYRRDPTDHDKAHEVAMLYVLHKAGLLETGIHKLQLEAALAAHEEAMIALADLNKKGIAND